MDRDFWLQRWEEGRIGFHQAEPTPQLVAFADRMGAPGKRVFVPLAGKSNDMAWLAARGDTVVGVELAAKAVTAFFDEHGLVPTVSRQGKLERYEANRVVLFAGDFFDLRREDVGDIDWVFDRAAFFALPGEMRVRYAAHMTELLGERAVILLLTILFDLSAAGPPFPIADEEVERLYGAAFRIQKLEDKPGPMTNERLRAAGIQDLVEKTWLLSKGFSR